MTSVEALGWWLADRPQTEAREPFIETRMPLDRETVSYTHLTLPTKRIV